MIQFILLVLVQINDVFITFSLQLITIRRKKVVEAEPSAAASLDVKFEPRKVMFTYCQNGVVIEEF